MKKKWLWPVLVVTALFVCLSIRGAPAESLDVKTYSQALSAGAMSATYTFSDPGRLLWIMVHASAATTETINVTFDSLDGSTYDTLLKTNAWVAQTDYFWAPDTLWFRKGDAILLVVTNGSAVNTVYATICVAY